MQQFTEAQVTNMIKGFFRSHYNKDYIDEGYHCGMDFDDNKLHKDVVEFVNRFRP